MKKLILAAILGAWVYVPPVHAQIDYIGIRADSMRYRRALESGQKNRKRAYEKRRTRAQQQRYLRSQRKKSAARQTHHKRR